jgi:hypothetical protein
VFLAAFTEVQKGRRGAADCHQRGLFVLLESVANSAQIHKGGDAATGVRGISTLAQQFSIAPTHDAASPICNSRAFCRSATKKT